MSQAEVVLSSELAPILLKWKEQWEAERPQNSGLSGFVNGHRPRNYNSVNVGDIAESNRPMGAISWLVEKSGKTDRVIWRVLNQEYKTVTLELADALLQAIERPDVLGLEVKIIPNPSWTQETYIAYMKERGCI